jgi:hypothetical protein
MNYFALITPLIAGVIAVYGIFPDVFAAGSSPRRKFIAVFLIIVGLVTSIWSAYSAYADEKYLSSWQAVENLHDQVDQTFKDFQNTIVDTDRIREGTEMIKDETDLIKQGRFDEAQAKIAEAQKLIDISQPDKQKLAKVVDEIRELEHAADHQGVSQDMQYHTLLFCVTLETIARMHSTDPDMPPLLLFESIMKDDTSTRTDQFVVSPQWSELLWSTSYFRPSDFAPPLSIVTVDDEGRLNIDRTKFDESFLLSRASYLLDWFHNATR